MLKIIPQSNALLLTIKVVPNSSRTCIAGVLGDALKIKVAPPPEGGKANEAVLTLLAETLGLPRAQVSLISGHTNSRKTVQLAGIDEAAIRERLVPPRKS